MSKTGTTVTLSFKYQTTGLDSGEYLAVDVYNGSTWTQVASYTGTAAATNKSINVTSYQSTNFKVRFRTKMNAADEYAYMDNVSVSVTY
jgi:predicted methyltransferase